MNSYPPDFLVGLAISGLKKSFFIASIKMNVFSKIKGKKISLNDFSKELKIPEASARAMVQNLCNDGLLNYRNGNIFNSKLSEAYLVDDEVLKELFIWLSSYSPTPDEVISILQDPAPQPWYSIMDNRTGFFKKIFQKKFIEETFYTDPHLLRIKWGEELSKKYDFSNHKCLLDIGGACGGWSVGILNKNNNLRAIIFERKGISKIIKNILNKHVDLSERINVFTGDFFNKLPSFNNCDVVLMANVLHDWSPKDCKIILKNVISSVKSKTIFLINEFYFDNFWKKSNYGALQSMLVLGCGDKSGWQPSYNEMKNLLKSVGLKIIDIKDNLIVAEK